MKVVSTWRQSGKLFNISYKSFNINAHKLAGIQRAISQLLHMIATSKSEEQTMRVGMYYTNSDVRVEEIAKPAIGHGEFLMKVMGCGICGSDIMEWYRIKKAPLVLGHEATGEIVEVGGDVTRYKVGQRVFVSHHIPCNTCHYCLNGHHTACETLHTTNYDPGGFAEYVRVPSLNVDRGTFVLPDEMSYAEGVFIEPLACVVRALRTVNFRPGQTLLILGSGMSGLLHLVLSRTLGAGRIITTDISAPRIRAAEKFGADAALDAKQDIPAEVRRINDGRGVDLAVVCAGALPAFLQALKSVDRGGTVLFFAPTLPGIDLPVPVNEFWRNEIKLTPSYGCSPHDVAVAIELLRFGRVNVAEMITHRLSLDEIGLGFKLASEGKESIKVVIEPHKAA